MSPHITSSHHGNVTVGSNLTIACLRNIISQSRLQLVDSQNSTVHTRSLVTRSNSSHVFFFRNLRVRDSGTYRCKETFNGSVKYSNNDVQIVVNGKIIVHCNVNLHIYI